MGTSWPTTILSLLRPSEGSAAAWQGLRPTATWPSSAEAKGTHPAGAPGDMLACEHLPATARHGGAHKMRKGKAGTVRTEGGR